MQRGAIGYVTKDVEPEALVHAIRCAARGELCMPRALTRRVLAHLRMLEPVNHTEAGQEQDFTQQLPVSTRSTQPIGPSPITYKIPQRPTVQSVDQQGKVRPLTDREWEILDLMRK